MATILFPDRDALRLALASGAVPDAVARAPARAGTDAHGRLWIEPSVALPRTAKAALTRQGAMVQGTSAAELTESAECWEQLLPLTPAPPAAADAPVLFDLPDATAMPPFLAELRRLGSGRVGFRVGERESRALVLVERPPLTSILRAVHGSAAGLHAFVRQAPRVWVEYGYLHPLAERIAPPAGQVALLGAPREWEWLTDTPFKSGPELFTIPAQLPAARDAPGELTIPLDLRLVASRDADPGALWVLSGPAIASLQSFVEQSDDRLIGRLQAAFATVHYQPVVLVRVRPGKGAPPVLVLDGAKTYRTTARLPNLYVPCGLKLRPPLRRDAVRNLLAADPQRAVWLEETTAGRFVVHSLPESAFRPLPELVEYRVDRELEMLTSSEPQPILPLGSYAVSELRPAATSRRARPSAPTTPTPPAPATESPEAEGWLHKIARWFTPRFGKGDEPPAVARRSRAALPAEPPPSSPPLHAWEERRHELENRFLATAAPNDAERTALWPELAGLYAALNLPGDAAACWLHALWDDENGGARWARGWLAAEARTSNPESELERWLTGTPTPANVRTVAAFVVWSAAQDAPPAALGAALTHAQRLLDNHEGWLPIRAAWLSRAALSQLTGGDPIGLARCRDRLLERLYHHGLSADLDVPTFLRFAGQVTGERRQEVRDWLLRTGAPIHNWVAVRPQQPASARHSDAVLASHDLRLPEFGLAAAPRGTRGYVDLILAWALARLGERAAHLDLIAQGRATLGSDDPVHAFLADAYAFRIGQALEGRTHAGPLDAPLLARLGELAARERDDPIFREQRVTYKIERLRQSSRILEPVERVRAYEEGHLERGTTPLRGVADRDELAGRLTELLAVPPDRMPRALAVALDLAPRVGEAFANGVLDRLLDVVDRWGFAGRPDQIEAEVAALERGWFVAAHFDRTEAAQRLTRCLGRLLNAQIGVDQSDGTGGAEDALLALVGQGLRGLRRLGLRDESDRLLDRLTEWVAPVGTAQPRPAALRRRLHLTGGWFYVGRDAEANAALDEARLFLFSYDLPARDQTNIACAYVAALGQAPVRLALGRIEEVFQRLQGVYDQLSTNSHFSLARLRVVEAAVLALVNDDFALGPTVRRWLDDDEFRVRQRINRDLRALVGAEER